MQKSRLQWLHLGNKNTNFLHTATLIRRRNRVKGLQDDTGNWVFDQRELKNMAVSFYSSPFRVDPYLNIVFPKGLFPSISGDKLDMLQGQCLVDEVKYALHEMGSYIALGPDEFHAAFFKRTWLTTGPAIVTLVKHVMARSALPKGLAEVLLVIIPKNEYPTAIIQFRPLSLCNVTYKITKLLTNRLKRVLGNLIAPAQSSFIPEDSWLIMSLFAKYSYTLSSAKKVSRVLWC